MLKEQKTPAGATKSLPPQTHKQRLEERLAIGKELRKQTSRKAHAGWVAPANRPDPIDLLIESSQGRVESLVPIRYGRMAASPFAFYRGAAAIMASDLASTPATGLNLQICGDCHLLNFGGFATAERKLVFDINDFDETSVAPWEWDVKRLAASFVIAGRSKGFAESDNRGAAFTAVQSYRQTIASYIEQPVLDVWYEALDLGQIIASIQDKKQKRFYTRKLQAASEQSAHEKEFARLAFAAGSPPSIIDQPPLIYHSGDRMDQEYRQRAQRSLSGYMDSLPPERRVLLNRFQLVDLAFKAVGVGSVGTFCSIGLLISGNGDPLFLQIKEARQSVLEPYAGASPYAHRGERVVSGQRLMQAASDLFLGWTIGQGPEKRHFYVRQLNDAKIKPVVELMKPVNLKNYARLTGHALARAHARSGDAAVLAGYMGKGEAFEEAITQFAADYADQNERDHAALLAAIRSGRIESTTIE